MRPVEARATRMSPLPARASRESSSCVEERPAARAPRFATLICA